MSDEMLFHAALDLTPVQAEMLMQLVHAGLSGKLNAGWRRPEEWVALTTKVTEALALGRNAFPGTRKIA